MKRLYLIRDLDKYKIVEDIDEYLRKSISKEEIIQWVKEGKIPDEKYKELAKPLEPLPKELYIDYSETNDGDAFAQFHLRGISPEDYKAYKSGKKSFKDIIIGVSLHCDLRMKFKNGKFIQWVILQDYMTDYIDMLTGKNDPKTGNVSKALIVVKPSSVEPSKNPYKESATSSGKEMLIDEKGAEIVDKYIIHETSFWIDPGNVGSTPYTYAYLGTIWLGKAKALLQRKDAHEYILEPLKSIPRINQELFNGRFIIRAFKDKQGRRWWGWKAKDNPLPMDSIKHSDCGYYYPVYPENIEKFGREVYRDMSRRLFLKKLK